MRIDESHSVGVPRPQEKVARVPDKPPAGRPAREGDSAEISNRAREIQKAKDAVLALPETREERIEAIRARIARGDYHISAREVADRLFDEVTGQAPEGTSPRAS